MAFIMVTFLVFASLRYFSGLTWTSSVHAGFREPLSWSLYLPRWGLESAFPRVDVSNESQGISFSIRVEQPIREELWLSVPYVVWRPGKLWQRQEILKTTLLGERLTQEISGGRGFYLRAPETRQGLLPLRNPWLGERLLELVNWKVITPLHKTETVV